MRKTSRLNRLQLALLLSLLLHGTIVGSIYLARIFHAPERPPLASEDMVLELQDAAENPEEMKDRGQIVETDETPLNNEVDADSKFLSAHNQRVEHETRAEKVDAFKNSPDLVEGPKAQPAAPVAQIPKDAAAPQEQNRETQQSTEPAAREEIAAAGDGAEVDAQTKSADTAKAQHSERPRSKLGDLAPSFRPDFSKSETTGGERSATDDHLTEVVAGAETHLSTREFIYYSYYNRIKKRLRQYWEPKIKEKFEKMVRQGKVIEGKADHITQVVIVLDRTGTLVGVQVLGPSGVHELDDAAVEAFRAAAPFPNPPAGIVESDGRIKIRWDFVLEA